VLLFEHQLIVTKDLSIVRWQGLVTAAEKLTESFRGSENFTQPLTFSVLADGLSLRAYRAGRTSILKLAVNRRDYSFLKGRSHVPVESVSFEEDFMIRCLLLVWALALSESEGYLRVDGSQSGWQVAADYVARVTGLSIDLDTDERFTFNNQDRSPATAQDRQMFEDLLNGSLSACWKPEHSLSWFF